MLEEEETYENGSEMADVLIGQSSPNNTGRISVGFEAIACTTSMACSTSLSLAKRSPTIVSSGRKTIKGDSTLVETAFSSFNEVCVKYLTI